MAQEISENLLKVIKGLKKRKLKGFLALQFPISRRNKLIRKVRKINIEIKSILQNLKSRQ